MELIMRATWRKHQLQDVFKNRYQQFFEPLEFSRYLTGNSYESKDGSEKKMSR